MRIFVTRVSAPTPIQEHGTKWQIVIEHDDGSREMFDPERVTLTGAWTFGRDETGTPTVWLKRAVDVSVLTGEPVGEVTIL